MLCSMNCKRVSLENKCENNNSIICFKKLAYVCTELIDQKSRGSSNKIDEKWDQFDKVK